MRRRTLVLSLFTALAGAPTLSWAQMGGGGMGGGGMGGMGGGPPGGGRPGGRRGGGAPGGRPGGAPTDFRPPVTAKVNYTGMVALSGQEGSLADKTVAAVKADQSVFLLTRGAHLKLERVAVSAAIPLSAFSEVSLAGLGAAIVALEGAVTEIIDGKIDTRQTGLTGLYASGPGTRAVLKTTQVTTLSAFSPGIVLSGGAQLEGLGLIATTQSDHAPALDILGGEAMLDNSKLVTSGSSSPAASLSGRLTGRGARLFADREPALDIKGPSQVQLDGCELAGGHVAVVFAEGGAAADMPGAPPPGFNMSGPPSGPARGAGPGMGPSAGTGARPASGAPQDGPPPEARFDMAGGSLKARAGLFQVYNCRAVITLDGVAIAPDAGALLKSSARKLGDSGGRAVLNARRQQLNGHFETDIISAIQLNLSDGSSFRGTATSNVNIAIDATSRWTLTGDTSVRRLDFGDAAPEQALARIDSGGFTLSYNKGANPRLGGQSFALPGGGKLQADPSP